MNPTLKQVKATMLFHKRAYELYKQSNQPVKAYQARKFMLTMYLQFRQMRNEA